MIKGSGQFSLIALAMQTLLLTLCVCHMTAASEETSTQSVGKIRSAADLAFSKGDVEESAKLWQQVISLEPNNEQNYYKLFRVHLRQKKHKEAIHDLNECLNLKPDHVQSLSQRGKLLLKVGRCTEAENDFRNLAK
jgi:tetratricopeptide (TPR) repeat protein